MFTNKIAYSIQLIFTPFHPQEFRDITNEIINAFVNHFLFPPPIHSYPVSIIASVLKKKHTSVHYSASVHHSKRIRNLDKVVPMMHGTDIG